MPRKNVEITQEMVDTVISMYKEKCPLADIERAIGHSDKIVYKILADNNIELNRKKISISDDDVNNMIKLYKEGYNYQEIADSLGVCGRSKVYNILHDSGVLNSYDPGKIFSIIDSNNKHQGNRKYFFDEHIFDEINTPDKAYCIGLFMADGCNQLEKG